MLIILTISFAGLGFLYYQRMPRRTLVNAKTINGSAELKPASKVVSLPQETAAVENDS